MSRNSAKVGYRIVKKYRTKNVRNFIRCSSIHHFGGDEPEIIAILGFHRLADSRGLIHTDSRIRIVEIAYLAHKNWAAGKIRNELKSGLNMAKMPDRSCDH